VDSCLKNPFFNFKTAFARGNKEGETSSSSTCCYSFQSPQIQSRDGTVLKPHRISLFELANDLGITNVFSASKEASLAKNARNAENPNGIDP